MSTRKPITDDRLRSLVKRHRQLVSLGVRSPVSTIAAESGFTRKHVHKLLNEARARDLGALPATIRYAKSERGYIDPRACIGMPPEHRDHRWTYGIEHRYAPDIHPSAIVEAFATIDAGTNRRTAVGARTWIMKRVHLGHDVVVGDDCELSPGVTLGGHTTVGNHVRIGVNACTRPGITIGDGARIGCGAVVVKDVPAGETWVGNPARKLERRIKNYTVERVTWAGRAAEDLKKAIEP